MPLLRSKQAPVGHTAGIYADMSLDGPEIGTLVAVVDRAKNLPNRKTMGKQDPYCAMRLAKEARKTSTDRRGGQTPKWDQELRFTVHDSPDYYKLKCSVFNDDKKTDLIGEAWVDLRDVIKQGGGQSDFWQQLNFKGKYAGDIRIELTYYDSREKPVPLASGSDTSQVSHSFGDETSSNSPNGARQLGPREIRRRPLPANPVTQQQPQTTSLSRSRGSQLPPPPPQIQDDEEEEVEEGEPSIPMHAPIAVRPHEKQSDDSHEQYPDQSEDYQPISFQHPQSSEELYDHGYQQVHQQQQSPQQPWQYPPGKGLRDYPESPETYNYTRDEPYISSGHSSLLPSPSPDYPSAYAVDQEQWNSGRPAAVHTYSDPVGLHSSSPSVRPVPSPYHSDSNIIQYRQSPPHQQPRMSPVKAPVFKDSPLRHSMVNHDHHNTEDTTTVQVDQPPPAPPKHRETPPRKSRNEYPPSSYAPQPLRSNAKRTSVYDRSPLQALEDSSNPHRTSTVAQRENLFGQTSHDDYSRTTFETPQRDPVLYQSRRSSRGIHDSYSNCGDSEYPEAQNYSQEQIWTNHMTEEPYHLPLEHDEYQPGYEDGRQYRSAASTRSISPNPQRETMRKAVGSAKTSPHPDDRRLSGVPFGPDAYDVFNPASSPVSNEGTLFETPEQAKASQRVRDEQRARDEGPIIGNDGRVIDPSDHLPSNTWAPEPERKTKKPEHVIHIRSRNNPSGSTPNRSSAVIIRHGGNSHSNQSSEQSFNQQPAPAVNTRNRLQKPISARPLPAQPYVQPPKHQTPTPPRPQVESPHQVGYRCNSYIGSSPTNSANVARPSLDEYQVPIGNNYSSSSHRSSYQHNTTPTRLPAFSAGHSPHEQRHSYYGGMEANTYDDPLVAEMSMIDIGPSRGHNRSLVRTNRGY